MQQNEKRIRTILMEGCSNFD